MISVLASFGLWLPKCHGDFARVKGVPRKMPPCHSSLGLGYKQNTHSVSLSATLLSHKQQVGD
jgi:hypothetical protein